jgi:YD repeat-containing protein
VTTTTYTTGATAAFGGGVTPPGLPMAMAAAGGATQTVEYFSNGGVARITDPAGKVTTFTYDGLGRVVTKTDTTGAFSTGLTTTIAYDKSSRVVSETSPAVTNRVTGAVHTAVSTTEYTEDGQTESQTVSDTTGGDASRTVSATYNDFGQQATSTDAAGKTTTYEYDAYGRIVREIGADGDVVETAFDANGQLLTTKVKNFTGDPNAPSAPTDLVVTSRAYDPAGRLAIVTDAMGWQTLYDYTDNGLMAKVTRKNPATGATFVQQETIYNFAGHVTTSKTNNGATITTHEIDQAGRVIQSTVDGGGLNRVTAVTYSADDFVLNTTAGSGGAVASTDTIYDALGRPVASTTGNGALAPVGRWRLNDGLGTAARDSAGNSLASISGGVTWSSDHGGSAVFDGLGGSEIATGGAVLDTARSFTVSAWVKLNAGTTGNKTAVSQDGQLRGAFYLNYEATTDKWRMMMCPPHPNPGNCVSALSTSAPVRDSWTHLTGVYDEATGKIRLYVNGAFEMEVSKTIAWNSAVGPLRIGRTKWNGGFSDHWPGSVSDVHSYQRALTNAQVADVYAGSLPAAGVGVVRTSRVLDESGLPLSETNANGQTTDYSLDEAGRVAVVTRPAVMTESGGGTPVLTRPVSYTGYDTFGAVVETKNPNGNVTVTAYDAAGRVDTVTMPNYTPPGSSTSITAVSSRDYNDVGQLITETDPLGKTTNYLYDQLGRVARVTTAELGVVKYAYDLIGDRVSVTDPTGAVNASTYDYLGRPLTSTQVVRQSGSSYTTNYTYGFGGWLASTQSPAGVVTSTTYKRRRPTSERDGRGERVHELHLRRSRPPDPNDAAGQHLLDGDL